jgi:hypothetical protein
VRPATSSLSAQPAGSIRLALHPRACRRYVRSCFCQPCGWRRSVGMTGSRARARWRSSSRPVGSQRKRTHGLARVRPRPGDRGLSSGSDTRLRDAVAPPGE